jgi:H+/Cl- antiporter ClcA
MTFAVCAYALITMPLLLDDPTPLIIESLFPENELVQILTLVLSSILSIIFGMYIIRALWNRLFPSLCGWNVINLAECYAISLFLTVLLLE